MPKPRPELPTDSEPKELVSLAVTPIARFSVFPLDLLARYINHKVEFEVLRRYEDNFKWEVRKLS